MPGEHLQSIPAEENPYFRVTLPGSLFDMLEGSTLEINGTGFVALTEYDPVVAYEALLIVTRSMSRRGYEESVKHNIPTKDTPDGDDKQALDVVVSVLQRPTFKDRLRFRKPVEEVAMFRAHPLRKLPPS